MVRWELEYLEAKATANQLDTLNALKGRGKASLGDSGLPLKENGMAKKGTITCWRTRNQRKIKSGGIVVSSRTTSQRRPEQITK